METATAFWFDQHAPQDYADSLYQASAVATAGIAGLGQVTDDDIARFHEQGFLTVHDAFTPAEVQAMGDGLHDLLMGRNPDFTGVMYEAAAKEIASTLPVEQRMDAVRKFWRFVDYDERLKAIAEHPALTAVLARIMDDRPELFQDMALIKPPRIGREKPWHQDCAYFALPVGTTVVGVWIALDEADVDNGCMHIIPGSHREGPVVHFQRRDWQICDTDVAAPRAVAVPLQPGGALLFHGLLHHGTPANHSDLRRRAVQYHYKPASVAWTSQEDRLAVFGSEGKDVTC